MNENVLPRPIHPFPARMADSIPRELLEATNGRRLTVLDPMVGSGTTAVVARSLGHTAIGYDRDPLAVLIARSWCDDMDPKRVAASANGVLDQARKLLPGIRSEDAYPRDADDETRAFADYWFDETNRRQLAALASAIQEKRNDGVSRVLWCAFSRLIIAKHASAALAMDIPHSRPHKVDTIPIRPVDHFLSAVEKIIRSAPFLKQEPDFPKSTIRVADAREMPRASDSVDLVITSPPYLNAIDYLRGHKFTLVWMGHSVKSLRAVRATNIGTEVGLNGEVPDSILRAISAMGDVASLPPREAKQLTRYATDMSSVAKEIHRVLKPGAMAVTVVGDTTRRGVFIRNSAAITKLCETHGLRLVDCTQRDIPPNRRYLPPPKTGKEGLDARLRREVILKFEKTS